jgi:hypothetical protein
MVTATFALAWAQVRTNMPFQVQRRICLRIEQEMIRLSSHCIAGGMDDIGLGNHTRTSRAHHQGQRSDSRRVTMTTSLDHGSARIYQFPAGGRAALGDRRRHGETETKSAVDREATHLTEVNCSGSWYHAAAIEEALPAWER